MRPDWSGVENYVVETELLAAWTRPLCRTEDIVIHDAFAEERMAIRCFFACLMDALLLSTNSAIHHVASLADRSSSVPDDINAATTLSQTVRHTNRLRL